MKTSVFFIGLALACQTGSAQTSLANTGTLYISTANDTVYITGDLTNNSSAALTNNGRLYVGQNITNDQAAMATGTGTLLLNGSAAQNLGGAQPFKTYNLVTNNSAGITLNADLGVSGVHTFSAGLIHSSATPNYLIYEAGSSHSGSTDARHVTGWVKKNGNSNFTFPVGDNTFLRSVDLSGITAVSEFNARYSRPAQNIYNLFSPLVKVRGSEYWQIDRISGGNANVTLNWDNAKLPMDNVLLADIVAARYFGGNWNDAGGVAIGDVATTGSVTSSLQTSFGPFTLGYKSFPIPLKLMSFTGWRRTGVSYLHWVTENEADVDRFAIQRSYDGSSFTTIGNVSARNRGIKELYSFDDPTQFTGTAYYRLCSYDRDGTFSYSKLIAITESNQDMSSFVVINPVRTAITIFNKTSQGGMFDYRLLNLSGQLIIKGSINLSSNTAGIIRLPLHITTGIYSLELVNERTRFLQQILVEK
jgi:hypothetical protein